MTSSDRLGLRGTILAVAVAVAVAAVGNGLQSSILDDLHDGVLEGKDPSMRRLGINPPIRDTSRQKFPC